MKFLSQAHAVYRCRYHVIWIPKYRRKVLVSGVDEYLEKVVKSYLSESYPDVIVRQCSIQPDHIHTLLEIPPKYSVAKVIGDVKANTARLMRQNFEYLRRARNLWSVGYFVSTVGTNESIITAYIQNQEKQDKGRSQIVLGDETTGGA